MGLNLPKTMPNPYYGEYGYQPSTVPMSGGGTASAIGGGMNAAGDAGLMSGIPPAMIARGVLKGAGLIANIYGAYQADKAAQQQRREQQRQFDIQTRQRDQDRQDRLEQQGFNNDITSGNYAQDYRKNIDNIYGNYYARNRM